MKQILALSLWALVLGMTVLAQGGTPASAKAPAQLPDASIQALVEHRLSHLGDSAANIQISVTQGVVSLKGTVPTLYAKEQAEQAALGAEDVNQVDNQLTIPMAGHSDDEMAMALIQAIRSYPRYDVFDWVDGSIYNGVVTLRGWAREPSRIQDYERLADRVPGVQKVDNQISLLPLSGYDEQLRVAAYRAIYLDPLFERYDQRALPPIHIIVDGGRILLKGTVSTPVEKKMAENLVRTGVNSLGVTNELEVEAENPQ